MQMDGEGVKSSWIKLQLPTSLIIFAGILAIVLIVAMCLSPELAGKIGTALTGWLTSQK
jgi:hypothetical protein